MSKPFTKRVAKDLDFLARDLILDFSDFTKFLTLYFFLELIPILFKYPFILLIGRVLNNCFPYFPNLEMNLDLNFLRKPPLVRRFFRRIPILRKKLRLNWLGRLYFKRRIGRITLNLRIDRRYPGGRIPSLGLKGRKGRRYLGCRNGRLYVKRRIGRRYIGRRIGRRYVKRRTGRRYIGRRIGRLYLKRRIGRRYIGRRIGLRYLKRRIGRLNLRKPPLNPPRLPTKKKKQNRNVYFSHTRC